MKHNTETIIDENGIEILVGYDYEISDSQIEECHGFHEVGQMVYTELKTVEVVIKGTGIDLLPLMNNKQKAYIIEQLNYEA